MSNDHPYSPGQYSYSSQTSRSGPLQYNQPQYGFSSPQQGQQMDVPDRGAPPAPYGHITPHYRSLQPNIPPGFNNQAWQLQQPSFDHRDTRTMDETYVPPPYRAQSQEPLSNIPNSAGGPPPPGQVSQMPPYDMDSRYYSNAPGQHMHPQSAPMPINQKYGYDYQNLSSAPSRSTNNPGPPPHGAPAGPAHPVPVPRPFDEAEYRTRAEHAFTSFDRDQSGHLDFQDFLEALRNLNLTILLDDARRHFYGANLDANQRIPKREFVEIYIKQRRNWYNNNNQFPYQYRQQYQQM